MRIDFEQFAVRELGYASGRRMERHAHDYSNVTVVVSGEMEETTDTGEHRGRSCSVLLKPAGTMHANYILGRKGTRTVSVEFAATSIYGLELQKHAWQWLEDPATARAGLALYAAVRASSREEIEARACDVVASALGAASSGSAPAPAWLTEVRCVLDQRFDEPLRFETLAAEAGVHPVYLSRAFRRHVGVPMGEYVRALRLKHARHLLSTTERSLAAISADTGFADASHLCRVFAEAHAVTPRAFRMLVAEARGMGYEV